VPSGPVTRARTKNLKKALNGPVQNIWRKMVLEELGTPRDHGRLGTMKDMNMFRSLALIPTDANLVIS
jgi:hypothetical protein